MNIKLIRKSFQFLILISIIALLSACGGGGGGDDEGSSGGLSTNACGVLGVNSRIINGTACSNSEQTPVVRVFILQRNGNFSECSGTMITANQVLTASHCVLNNMERFGIFVGDDFNNPTVIDGSSFISHPSVVDIEDGFLLNDLAVMTLNRNAGLPTLPILLSKELSKGDVFSIFGFGVDDSGDVSDFLRSGEMKIEETTPDIIFALFNGEGSNTCEGDSGGPIVSSFNGVSGIIGVTSAGVNQDCQPDDVSIFANIQSNSAISFINEVAPGAQIL